LTVKTIQGGFFFRRMEMEDIGKWFESMIVESGPEPEPEPETISEPEPKAKDKKAPPRPKKAKKAPKAPKGNAKPLTLNKAERRWIDKLGADSFYHTKPTHVFGGFVLRTDGKSLVQVKKNVYGKIDPKDLCEKSCMICNTTKEWEYTSGKLYNPNTPCAIVEKGVFKKALVAIGSIINEDHQRPVNLLISGRKNTVVVSGKNTAGESGKVEIDNARVSGLTVGGKFPMPILRNIASGSGKDTVTIYRSTANKMAWAFVTDKMSVIVNQVKAQKRKKERKKERKESY